ncbi:MAG: Uma2 family endonuclease [Acidobacteriota bacterium]
MTPTRPELKFTYEDYLLLPEDKRYELIDGDLCMVPAPSLYHQIVCRRIGVALTQFVDDRDLGEVLWAPCDVYLSQFDVVQPDMFFITSERRGIMKEAFVEGTPDLIVEIISPSDPKKDRDLKRKLYARFGAREYWIVDPAARSIDVLVREEDDLKVLQIFVVEETLKSMLLPDFRLPFGGVFAR